MQGGRFSQAVADKSGRKKINAFFHSFVILFGIPQIPLYRRSMIADPVSKEIDSEILFRHWHSLWSFRLHKECPLHSTLMFF
jgi:hypothetical protein